MDTYTGLIEVVNMFRELGILEEIGGVTGIAKVLGGKNALAELKNKATEILRVKKQPASSRECKCTPGVYRCRLK